MTASLWDGLLLLNKKSGLSSFDSLKGVKRAFATGKAGHTGTLDKFASGLLLVLVGRGLKLIPLFDHCVKEYTGTLRFGLETDTLDPEGVVIAQGPLPSREQVEAVLDAFRGNILQAPPAYSALHINGRRAHELAREGIAPEMKKRPVTVYDLEIVSWAPPEAVIHVCVSPGTYIRSLARDIALAAGSRSYLSSLTRTRVGDFHLEEAVEDDGDGERLVKALRPLDKKIFEALSLPCLFIDENEAEDFIHGRPLQKKSGKDEFFTPPEDTKDVTWPAKKAAGVFRKNAPHELLGTLEYKNGKWGYGHVFANS